VKQLYTAFGEKKALYLLGELERMTAELFYVGRDVLQLCEEFKAKIG
jgi:hypothetical protein